MRNKPSDPFKLCRTERIIAGLHMSVLDQGSLSRDLEIDEPLPAVDETFYPDNNWDEFLTTIENTDIYIKSV